MLLAEFCGHQLVPYFFHAASRLLCLSCKCFGESGDHDAGEGDVVEALEAGVKSIVIARESSEAVAQAKPR